MSTELRNFYNHEGVYFLAVLASGIILLDSFEDFDPPEAVLRLFMKVEDASRYKELIDHDDVRVGKITLIGLWSLLETINKLSMQQYECPVRVEVSAIKDDKIQVVDVLYSTYSLSS